MFNLLNLKSWFLTVHAIKGFQVDGFFVWVFFLVFFFLGGGYFFCISLLQKLSASFNRLQRLSIGHDNWSICLFPIMKQNINTPLDKWLRVVIHPRGQANISTAEARQLDQQNLQLHKLELTGKCAFLPSKTRVSIGAC